MYSTVCLVYILPWSFYIVFARVHTFYTSAQPTVMMCTYIVHLSPAHDYDGAHLC